MPPLTLLLTWIAAFLVAGLGGFGVTRLAHGLGTEPDALPAAPVVVIGSSLLRYAIPPFGNAAEGVLGDGRPHVRMARSSISEAQELADFELALGGPVETVLLEINPIAFDFASSASMAGRTWFEASQVWAQAAIDTSRMTLRDLGRMVRGKQVDNSPFVEAKLDRPFRPNKKAMEQNYPLYLRPPTKVKKLTKLLHRARSQGVRVVLVAPPRSNRSYS